MKLFIPQKSTSLIVIVAGCVLLLVSFGIRHSSGLYLIPISNQLGSGREIFGLAIAIQFLMIGFGLTASTGTSIYTPEKSLNVY